MTASLHYTERPYNGLVTRLRVVARGVNDQRHRHPLLPILPRASDTRTTYSALRASLHHYPLLHVVCVGRHPNIQPLFGQPRSTRWLYVRPGQAVLSTRVASARRVSGVW